MLGQVNMEGGSLFWLMIKNYQKFTPTGGDDFK